MSLFPHRFEADELALSGGSADGFLWGGYAQSCHVDRRIQLQPHSTEREGPEPRAGHHWSLRFLQTSFLRGLVLLEHWHSGTLNII